MEVRSVEAIVKALNGANVQYLIVGGLAVNAHGYERLTADVDLVIGLERDNILAGLRTLMSVGYRMSIPVTPEDFAVEENRERWRKEKDMIVLKLWSDEHRRTTIDVFVYEPFDFKSEYHAATWLPIAAEVRAPIVRFDTLVRMKTEAGRLRDLADVADLERVRALERKKMK
jgi:hypothetical protein